MWSLPNQSQRTIAELSAQSLTNLQYALNLDIIATALYDDSEISEIHAIYLGFENDGMFYSHPTLNSTDTPTFKYSEASNCQKDATDKTIDARCLYWYYETKMASDFVDVTDKYYDNLGIYQKRFHVFPSAYWNPNYKMVIVTLCSSLLNESKGFIGVLCAEVRTSGKILYFS